MPLSDLIARQKTMETYIKEDSTLARKLLDAGDNIELRRNAFKDNILDDFLIPIINDDNYVDFLDEITTSAIDRFPEEKTRFLESQLGLKRGAKKIEKKKKEKKAAIKKKKSISQVSRTGKVYNRSYGKWSSSENQFIKARIRKGYSASKTKEEFKSFYGSEARTSSSINTKYYRLKGRGN